MTSLIKKIILSIIAIYITVLLSIFAGIIKTGITILDTLIFNSVPVILGLIVFPKCIAILKLIKLENRLNLKINIWVLMLFILAIGLGIMKSNIGIELFVVTLVIAISEEYLFRYYLMDGSNSKSIIIISSLVFAFVVHSNEPFLSNLVIRFPLGAILGSVYYKNKNFLLPTTLHLFYNLLMI